MAAVAVHPLLAVVYLDVAGHLRSFLRESRRGRPLSARQSGMGAEQQAAHIKLMESELLEMLVVTRAPNARRLRRRSRLRRH